MSQTIEARQDNILPYSYHVARGVSADSQELSEKKQYSFDIFLGSSEVTKNYSSVFRQNAEPDTEKAIANKAFKDTLTKVYDLLNWQDNWNGYGALAPKLDTILYAITWLNAFYQFATGSSWRSPNVTAGPQGEVVYEWWNSDKKITIYISGQNAEYVKVWGPDIFTDMLDGDARSIEVCKELWAWLRG